MYRTLFVPSSRIPVAFAHISKSNLPVPLTLLVGREQIVAEVCALLRGLEVRLLTLIGTGGIGKTRLGLQVATHLLEDFRDGVCFVPLASVSASDLVGPTITYALGIREDGDWSPFDQLKAYLQDKHVLLLLDNFEQVVEAAGLLSDLLEFCPGLKILVTSRVALRIRGGYEYRVPPLAVPDLKRLPEIEAFPRYAAITLFIQRVQASNPHFQLTKANSRVIAEICARLDGLPLAIELAAARINLFSVHALLGRLEHRLQVLTSGARNLPLRHQTLRGTITWSYDLLNAEAQQLFRRLSIFVGGCTLEAAEAVCVPYGSVTTPILDSVEALIDGSFLQQTQQEGDEPRLVMLETIREYGLECLAMSGEMELIKQAHAEYFLRLAEEVEPELDGFAQLVWLKRLEWEHENLREALRWLEEQADGAGIEKALRLAGAIWRFWWIRGYWTEGRKLLERLLALGVSFAGIQISASVRAKALNAVGMLAFYQSDSGVAESLCEESLALFLELSNTRGIATALNSLGIIAWMRQDYKVACSLTEEALAHFRKLGDKKGVADSLIILGYVFMDRNEYLKARAILEESLMLYRESGNKRDIATALVTLARVSFFEGDFAAVLTSSENSLILSREVGDRWGIAHSLASIAYAVYFQGEHVRATTLFEEALTIFQELGDREGIALTFNGLGWVTFGQGDYIKAQNFYEESLAIAIALGHRELIALGPVGLGIVVSAQGQPVVAAHILGAGDAFREVTGMSLPPVAVYLYEQMVATTRAQLGEEAFAEARAEGRTMTLAQAMIARELSTMPVVAMPAISPASTPVFPSTYPAGLTIREVEVLRWAAKGLTNIQVAEQLTISPRTVSTHMSSIYNKLGVATRSAATRFAVEHHLV